ncbi:MAG: SocA family protein [Chloroflexi bacterium]|nr:SocA family protein [Chloroflexota bacterium]
MASPQKRPSASDVAVYFLSLVDEDEGDFISNLKLQKLLYYAQGFHLAMFDEPLFDETIEAWAHGPVVRRVYSEYADFGANPIPRPANLEPLGKDTEDFLNEIYGVFGQYSAWKLREMTHDEPPWKDSYRVGKSRIISHAAMKTYFSQFVESK